MDEYIFSIIARNIRKLRSYGLLKPIEKLYRIYEELIM